MSNEREGGDRTGLPCLHVYSLGSGDGARWFTHRDTEDGPLLAVSVQLGTLCPTDPDTAEIWHARDPDGRCAIWGQDAGGHVVWFRDDDPVARAAVVNVYHEAGLARPSEA